MTSNRPGNVHVSALARTWMACVILTLGLLVSGLLYFGVRANIEKDATLRFERQASDIHHNIAARVGSYIDVMYGLGALFRTAQSIPRAQFHNYVSGLDLPRRFPGFQTLNYAEQISAGDRPAFEARVRQDRSLDPRGYPEFRIRPAGQRGDFHVLTYLEPMLGNESSFGLDIAGYDDASRRAPLEHMRDTGQLFSSGRLIVIGGVKRAGLSMRLPVYRPGLPLNSELQRRAAFIGSLGAGFRVRDLMRGVIDQSTLETIRFQVYDGGPAAEYRPVVPSPDRLVFDSLEVVAEGAWAQHNGADMLRTQLPLHVAGRIWQIQFEAPKNEIISNSDRMLPWAVLVGGVLISVLLFGIGASLANSRTRAMALAAEITSDLQASEASLAEAQRIARLGNWSLQWASGAMSWSDETTRILGLDQAGAGGTREAFLEKIASPDLERFEAVLLEAVQSGRDQELECRTRGRESMAGWVHLIIRPGVQGGEAVLQGTIRDITERKQAAIRLDLEHRVTQLVVANQEHAVFLESVLEALCSGLELPCGLYWSCADQGTHLEVASVWCQDQPAVWEFAALSRKQALLKGADLPGQAWSAGEMVFLRELRSAACFGRAGAAAEAGLRGALAIPVLAGDRVAGVLELLAGQAIEPDSGLRQLFGAVANQIGQFLQRKHAEESLRFIAAHDSLTELPNRSMFNDRLRQAFSQASRYQRGLVVFFIDIDRFKLLNDTLGHGAGDRMLLACAKRLCECVRESDIVARLGGDEFVIMVENFALPREAITVAQKILASLARPFVIDGRELLITASIGIATYPDDGTDAETLLKNADIAMYRAKEQGRNNYQFYSAQMNKHTFERLVMETSLRRAVERGEFLLHYQPKQSLKTGAITGLEALVRWNHPDWGMVSPVQFIPLAEETGLISQIGDWVLRTACAQSQQWRARGLPPLRIAVNLSARQFSRDSLVKDIADIMQDSGLSPDWLELEITESLVMQSPEHAAQTLHRLKAMGITLAIDDFGTGYSSLAYLKRFPIDSIKIDRSFVKDIPHDADDMAITRGVIALGHSLRLQVVAEGVETPEQQQFLRANGCDELQGYVFSQPLSAQDATRLLETSIHAANLKLVEPRLQAFN